MKYDDNNALPSGVTDNLPDQAQEIYKSAYNAAHEERQGEEDAEQAAHRIAWAAVKQKYEKNDSGNWHRKQV